MEENLGSPAIPGPRRMPRLRRLLVIAFAVVLAAVFVGTYVFFARLRPSVDGGADLPITDRLSDLDGLIDQSKWRVLETQQRMRCDLVDVRQDVELIWEKIDELKPEIARYKRVYAQVAKSKKYPELLQDRYAIRYLADDIGEPLPHEKTPEHCAERLNVLMYTVNRALAKKKAAYEIQYQTMDRIESIAHDVNDALRKYRMQREFLEWLPSRTAAGALPEAETLEDAVQRFRLHRASRQMGHPAARAEDDRDKPAGGDTDRSKTRKTGDQTSGDSDVLRQAVLSRSETGDTAAEMPLIGDVVPDPYAEPEPYPRRQRVAD